jgi:hypothetical protein
LGQASGVAALDHATGDFGAAVLCGDLTDGDLLAIAPQGHDTARAAIWHKLLDSARGPQSFRLVDAKSILRSTMVEFISEFWMFLRVRKKYWLLPLLVMMTVFGGLLVLTKGSAVAPFIYTIF